MQLIVTQGWETAFIHELRMNLTLVIPVSTLMAKVLIQIFSRDQYKDVMRSLADFPLELMLIAMSFMLGALCGLSPNYLTRLGDQGTADLYAVVVIAVIFLGSLFINGLTKLLRILFGKIFVAAKQYQELLSQPSLPDLVPVLPNIEAAGRIIWTTFYCVLMVLVLLFCCGVPVVTLWYVLRLIQ